MLYICSHVTAKSQDKGHYTGKRGVSNSDVRSLFQNSYNNKIDNTFEHLLRNRRYMGHTVYIQCYTFYTYFVFTQACAMGFTVSPISGRGKGDRQRLSDLPEPLHTSGPLHMLY